MRLWPAVKNRLRIWRIIFWRPVSTVVAGVYAFFGAATFIRDNLLSSAAVAKLQILKYLPSWSVWEWLGVALLGAWIITLEGAYRLASDLEAKLKDKYTWSEIRSRLKEFVRSGNELIVRIEEYDTPGVGPIFYLQDVVEQWGRLRQSRPRLRLCPHPWLLPPIAAA